MLGSKWMYSWKLSPFGLPLPILQGPVEHGFFGVGEGRLFMGITDDVKEHLVRPGGVETVVHRPQVEMAPESHPTLTGPSSLRENKVIPTPGARASFDVSSQ